MQTVPKWYWIASVLALVWALAGCFAYWSQVSMTADDLAQLPPEQAAVWAMMPKWVVGASAGAAWAALAGTLGLLLRKSWARPALLVSLFGIAAARQPRCRRGGVPAVHPACRHGDAGAGAARCGARLAALMLRLVG